MMIKLTEIPYGCPSINILVDPSHFIFRECHYGTEMLNIYSDKKISYTVLESLDEILDKANNGNK